jgi:hypothetical protein
LPSAKALGTHEAKPMTHTIKIETSLLFMGSHPAGEMQRDDHTQSDNQQ